MLTPIAGRAAHAGCLQPSRSASGSASGRCTPEEIRANMGSVELCPPDDLPPGSLPWFALLLLAACGYDTYVYPSGAPAASTWCAWIGPLADVREDRNGRVPISRLGATCRAVLDELSDAERGAPEVTLLCQLLDERAHLWDWAGFLVDPCETAIELLETHISRRDRSDGHGHHIVGSDTCARRASVQEAR